MTRSTLERLGSADLTVVDDSTPQRAIDIHWSAEKRSWCVSCIHEAAKLKVNGSSVSLGEGEVELGAASTIQLGYRDILFSAATTGE